MTSEHLKTYRAALVCALLVLGACSETEPEDSGPPPEPGAFTPDKVVLSIREGKVRQFPCMECHDKVAPGAKPPLEGKHRDLVLEHFNGADSCGICHEPTDMNSLRLMTNEKVSFNEVFKVCGQCHAERRRDWEIGAHGKVVGAWRGVRHKYVCTDCHDAHKPGFGTFKASPAPPFPALGIPKTELHP